jgi:hypothetical protein
MLLPYGGLAFFNLFGLLPYGGHWLSLFFSLFVLLPYGG